MLGGIKVESRSSIDTEGEIKGGTERLRDNSGYITQDGGGFPTLRFIALKCNRRASRIVSILFSRFVFAFEGVVFGSQWW